MTTRETLTSAEKAQRQAAKERDEFFRNANRSLEQERIGRGITFIVAGVILGGLYQSGGFGDMLSRAAVQNGAYPILTIGLIGGAALFILCGLYMLIDR